MGAVAHLRDSSFRRLIISKRVDSIRFIEAFHSRASIGVDQDCSDTTDMYPLGLIDNPLKWVKLLIK
ncbi:hypothetical protein HanHA89_Chr03g0086601 [Helianthus annuus]|nr:hypothetical protein HanHA89_Chr03g0086601 [Helianthus annuus]